VKFPGCVDTSIYPGCSPSETFSKPRFWELMQSIGRFLSVSSTSRMIPGMTLKIRSRSTPR